MGKRTWTNREIEYVKLNHQKVSDRCIANKLNKTMSAVRTFRQRNSLTKTQPAGHYSKEEDQYLKDNYQTMWDDELGRILKRSVSSISGRRHKLGLSRTIQRKNGHFSKGHTPWNKGMKGAFFGSREGQYKKGDKPKNTFEIGKEILRQPDKNGNRYYFIKTEDGLIPKHRYVYESHHGPTPLGHIIVFKNGDTTDCNIENLMCITRAEHVRRNRQNGREIQPKSKRSFLDRVLMAEI